MGPLILSLPAGAQEKNDGVRLVCLNIGKADCMLLLYGDDAWLIDTGYEHTYPALETMLSQYAVRRLNGVILTHCHEDHEGGMAQLAASDIAVDGWYAPAIYYDVKDAKHPARLAAKERNAQVTWLEAGAVLPVSSDAAFTVLGPLQVNTDNENNNSLVMHFSSPHGSILFAGDMKEEEEEDLIRAGMLKPAQVLKVGHHGDNKATSQALLRIVQPKVAVILTHSFEEQDTPSIAALRRLNDAGCAYIVSQNVHDAILVTLDQGAVNVADISWGHVPAVPEGLTLSLDLANDLAIIENTGASPVNLEGMRLYSSKGKDTLTLPAYILAPGEQYFIGSRSTKGDYHLLFDKKRVWHESKRDMAILYDPYGRALFRTDNGFKE